MNKLQLNIEWLTLGVVGSPQLPVGPCLGLPVASLIHHHLIWVVVVVGAVLDMMLS